jgi:SNF2 family DNA or RNA helicase
MGQKRLTFQEGRFHLYNGESSKELDGLRAAAAFKQYADSKAEKVFNRAFNQLYFAPRLPRLSFLDPHQLDGVWWTLSRKRSYLAHAPGAGKTSTTIVAAWLKEHGRNVIIVPPGLTLNWQREIEKFWGQFSFVRPTVAIVNTEMREKEAIDWSANFLIVPDSMVSKPWVYKRLTESEIHLLAVDEASRLKEVTSERSVAFYGGMVRGKSFRGLFKRARHVVLLDGSPMPNGRPMELWAPVYALDPETIDCMGRHEYGETYCNAYEDRWGHWNYNGSLRAWDLRARLRRSFMHVVGEDQLAHPERRRSLLFIDYDVRSAKHRDWEQSNLAMLDVEKLDESASQGDFAKWRRELGLKKVAWSARYIIDRLKNKNESILVFAWHRDVAVKLVDLIGKNAGLVIGGTAPKMREAFFEQFQKGQCRCIVGNIQAMGRGHNLQRADRVIFVESSWSDELNRQCEKRASRRGRKKFVRCEYIIAPDSMDERTMSSVFTKERRTKAVIG